MCAHLPAIAFAGVIGYGLLLWRFARAAQQVYDSGAMPAVESAYGGSEAAFSVIHAPSGAALLCCFGIIFALAVVSMYPPLYLHWAHIPLSLIVAAAGGR